MEQYSDWRDYFKLLATQHKSINHLENVNKKFFESTLEEVVFGIQHELPGPDSGEFVIFVPYMDRLKAEPEPSKFRDIMYFILKSAGNLNGPLQTDAFNSCESVNDDFIRRFKYDSENGEAIWQYSFDAIEQVSILPHELVASGVTFKGVQVVISIALPFDDCFDANKWNL